MKRITAADIVELSADERLQLVTDVWESLAACPEAVPVTEEQRAELARRLEAHHNSPEKVSPWEDVRDRILSRK